jgi:hypothetical protein
MGSITLAIFPVAGEAFQNPNLALNSSPRIPDF